jgi:hypothetical protein
MDMVIKRVHAFIRVIGAKITVITGDFHKFGAKLFSVEPLFAYFTFTFFIIGRF